MRYTQDTITLNIFAFLVKQPLKWQQTQVWDDTVAMHRTTSLKTRKRTATITGLPVSWHFSPVILIKNTEANLKMHNSNIQMAIITGIEYPFSQKRLILLKKTSQLNEHGIVLFMNTEWHCRRYFIGIK